MRFERLAELFSRDRLVGYTLAARLAQRARHIAQAVGRDGSDRVLAIGVLARGEYGSQCVGNVLASDEPDAPVAAVGHERSGLQGFAEHQRDDVEIEIVAEERVRNAGLPDERLGVKVPGRGGEFCVGRA